MEPSTLPDSPSRTQTLQEGYGPCFHRKYRIRLPVHLRKAAQRAMSRLQYDLNSCSPQALAHFEKTRGEACRLSAGDEFLIHISGPWNGPVRVTEVTDEKFHLETLEGHMESGEIEFRLEENSECVEFVIESLARSRDRVVDFVYDKIPIAKLAQTEMWTYFCRRFAEMTFEDAGNELPSELDVEVMTERRDPETGQWERL